MATHEGTYEGVLIPTQGFLVRFWGTWILCFCKFIGDICWFAVLTTRSFGPIADFIGSLSCTPSCQELMLWFCICLF